MKRLYVLPLILFLFLNCSKPKLTLDEMLPTKDEVGAAVMPAEIAPIQAPFDMSAVKRPQFPERSYNITDFGAVEGGETLCRDAIQAAIDKASADGGGKVLIPAGKWLTGRIELKSNVNLELAEGAELHFSGEIQDYLPPVFCRSEGLEVFSLGAFIYAYKQENIALTGKGTLIGPDEGPARESVLKTVSDKIVSVDTPVKDRIYDGTHDPVYFRPYSISPVECKGVLVEGVTIVHGAFWNVVPVYCDNVIVRGVQIESVGVVNGDGVNIESSRNVLVEYCTVRTGDDSYCCKAGRNEDGIRTNRPVENVVFRNLLTLGGHGGITFGSETAGQIRNVYVHDCVFDRNDMGIRFKTRRPRGGGGEFLTIENIRMDVKKNAIEWDMLGLAMWVGELAERLPLRPTTPLTPYYRNITIRNVLGKTGRHCIQMEGLPESTAKDVLIENIQLECLRGITLTDGENIELKNIDITFTEEPLFNVRDSWNIATENVKMKTPLEPTVKIFGERCANINLDGLIINDGQKPKLVAEEQADPATVKF